jgi:hypothetical protein
MKTIKQILGIVIIMIAGFGIISNVLHSIGIRKSDVYDFKTSHEYKQINEIISDIKSKKDNLKDLSFIDSNDMKVIREYINGCYEGLNNLNLSKFEDVKEINDIDKYKLLGQIVDTRCAGFEISALSLIAKYDENINSAKQIYASGLLESMIALDPIKERLLHNYEYNMTLLDLPGGLSRPQGYEMALILNGVRTQALVLQYIIDYDLNKEV